MFFFIVLVWKRLSFIYFVWLRPKVKKKISFGTLLDWVLTPLSLKGWGTCVHYFLDNITRIDNITLFLVHWLGHDKTLREQGVDDSSTVLLRQVKKRKNLTYVSLLFFKRKWKCLGGNMQMAQ